MLILIELRSGSAAYLAFNWVPIDTSSTTSPVLRDVPVSLAQPTRSAVASAVAKSLVPMDASPGGCVVTGGTACADMPPRRRGNRCTRCETAARRRDRWRLGVLGP